jgi:predicted nucleic acid-binding protein
LSFVLDSSLSLAWCFEDEQTPPVMTLLDRITETGAVAPLLSPLEVLNALLAAERRRRIDGARRRTLASFLRDLPVALDGDTAMQALEAITSLAERFNLTTYDAAYLELAQRRRLPLASLDQELWAAAKARMIETLGVSG